MAAFPSLTEGGPDVVPPSKAWAAIIYPFTAALYVVSPMPGQNLSGFLSAASRNYGDQMPPRVELLRVAVGILLVQSEACQGAGHPAEAGAYGGPSQYPCQGSGCENGPDPWDQPHGRGSSEPTNQSPRYRTCLGSFRHALLQLGYRRIPHARIIVVDGDPYALMGEAHPAEAFHGPVYLLPVIESPNHRPSSGVFVHRFLQPLGAFRKGAGTLGPDRSLGS